MKKNAVIILLVPIAVFVFSGISLAQSGRLDVIAAFQVISDQQRLKDILEVTSPQPRGPQEVLRDYEAAMQGITQTFSSRLAAVAQAVESGELSREQGEKITEEQYQIAQMQFELLGAWHDMLSADLARAHNPQQQPSVARDEETVMAALPFNALQLDPSVSQYLGLNSRQLTAIQDLVTQQRRRMEPLMAQLRETKTKMLAATDGHQPSEKQLKLLADAQAQTLSKLIVENARMQAKLYETLTPDQQKKLDELKKSNTRVVQGGE